MEQWSLQDAKNKLSEVVDRAETRPQVITRRGKNTAVVLSYRQYLLLSRPAGSLLQGLLPEEPIGIDLDVDRDRNDVGREHRALRYLLDTCVLSEVVKARPTASVLAWLDCAQDCYLSCLTIGELEKGIALAADENRRAKLQVWLETRVLLQFSGRVLDVEVAVARQWGALQARLRREGVLLPAIDGLLAATALVHGLILVTRNERDFASTGVRVHNPWA